MSDIADFFSQADRIAELELQLLKASKQAVSWKSKFHKLNLDYKKKGKPKTNRQKAIELLKSGQGLSHKEIAAICFLHWGTVSNINSEILKGLHD